MNGNRDSVQLVWLLILLSSIGAGYVCINSQVSDWPYTDSKGSLLSAQALIENGSFDLTPYKDDLKAYGWQLYWTEESILYAYPYGSTIISIPAVWIALKLGMDLSDHHAEAYLNRILAAISVGLTFILTFVLFSRRCGTNWALVFSILIVFGTNVLSTMGLALWNLNYTVLIALLVLILIDSDSLLHKPDCGWILGVLLFFGFITRPSFSLLILAVFSYLALKDRKQLLRAGFVSFVLLCFYLILSVNTFGSLLPGHYKMRLFSDAEHLFLNFMGQLVSPSRGFFVFNPIFLLTLFGLALGITSIRRHPLVFIVLIWLVGLVTMDSAWFMWWGGGGFGNRLLTESLPAWIYLSAITWPDMLMQFSSRGRICMITALLMLGGISIWIHTIQGANNQLTVTWHHKPNKDEYPEYFWNMRFPQALVSESQLRSMSMHHRNKVLDEHGEPALTLDVLNPHLEYTGWSPQESESDTFRWTEGRTAIIHLRFIEQLISSPGKYAVGLDASTYMDQEIDLYVNGKFAGNVSSEFESDRMIRISEEFEVHPGMDLEIKLDVKNPRIPILEDPENSKDPRELGLKLYSVILFQVD